MTEENDLIFHEVQRFSLWFRLPFAFSIPILILIAGFPEKVFGLRQDLLELSWLVWAAIFLIFFSIVISIFFAMVKLETRVRRDGLYVRVFPFHTDYKKFTAESLSEYYVCKYRPLLEYGGWGIRFGKSGKAYNMRGNKGVQLVFKDGKRLLIGSQRPDELAEAMSSIMKEP